MFFLATKIAEQFSLNRLRRAPMHLRSQALAFGPWESYPKRKLYGYGLCKGGAPPPKKPKIRVSTGKPSIFGTSNFWCWGRIHQDAEMACNRAAANSQEDRPLAPVWSVLPKICASFEQWLLVFRGAKWRFTLKDPNLIRSLKIPSAAPITQRGQTMILLLQRINLRKVKVKSIWNSQSGLYFFQGQPFKKKAELPIKRRGPVWVPVKWLR